MIYSFYTFLRIFTLNTSTTLNYVKNTNFQIFQNNQNLLILLSSSDTLTKVAPHYTKKQNH